MTVNGKRYSVNGEWPAEATAVHDAGIQAALAAYENARMDGLCHEGAWECALNVLHSLNITRLAVELEKEIGYA